MMEINNDNIDIGHEAKSAELGEEMIFYLTQRGLDDDTAKSLIIKGYIEPITKELPLEYAVELNNLITIELEGAIG